MPRPQTKAAATAAIVAKGIVPRGLTRAEAAAYVGLSARSFSARVRESKLPPAHPVTGRWDRAALDRALGPTSDEEGMRAAIDAAIEAI